MVALLVSRRSRDACPVARAAGFLRVWLPGPMAEIVGDADCGEAYCPFNGGAPVCADGFIGGQRWGLVGGVVLIRDDLDGARVLGSRCS